VPRHRDHDTEAKIREIERFNPGRKVIVADAATATAA
jgi:hypothetical protein